MTWQLVQWVKMCCFPSATKVTADLMTRSGQNDRGRRLSVFVFSYVALVVGTDGIRKLGLTFALLMTNESSSAVFDLDLLGFV